MANKYGRPPVPCPRQAKCTVSISADDLRRLDFAARAAGVTRSSYAHRALIERLKRDFEKNGFDWVKIGRNPSGELGI